jgi:hypothetical protein
MKVTVYPAVQENFWIADTARTHALLESSEIRRTTNAKIAIWRVLFVLVS